MIVEEFYLSDEGSLERACALCELSEDEIEAIVGRFRPDHWRFAGKLKGQMQILISGEVRIIHHFTKRILWSTTQ